MNAFYCVMYTEEQADNIFYEICKSSSQLVYKEKINPGTLKKGFQFATKTSSAEIFTPYFKSQI